jgi:hypothetical protein
MMMKMMISTGDHTTARPKSKASIAAFAGSSSLSR